MLHKKIYKYFENEIEKKILKKKKKKKCYKIDDSALNLYAFK